MICPLNNVVSNLVNFIVNSITSASISIFITIVIVITSSGNYLLLSMRDGSAVHREASCVCSVWCVVGSGVGGVHWKTPF